MTSSSRDEDPQSIIILSSPSGDLPLHLTLWTHYQTFRPEVKYILPPGYRVAYDTNSSEQPERVYICHGRTDGLSTSEQRLT
jgi:hypothetical protein